MPGHYLSLLKQRSATLRPYPDRTTRPGLLRWVALVRQQPIFGFLACQCVSEARASESVSSSTQLSGLASVRTRIPLRFLSREPLIALQGGSVQSFL